MTTWVLLRGLAREARHWGEFASTLQAQLPVGDVVVALDLPGNGSRWLERSPASVVEMVACARQELATLPAKPPYVLVALSLGGMVALAWAAQDATKVRGCVLINSSVGDLSPFWRRLRPSSYRRLANLLRPGRMAIDREREVLQLTSNLPVSTALARAWASHAQTAPVTYSNFARQLLAAVRFRSPGHLPSVPMLLLASRADALVSHRCSQDMARAWQAALREHPSAGHDLPLDDPDWVIRQILEWHGPVRR
jgi:pimeloyl-ACP methyl ester carboxylesterase